MKNLLLLTLVVTTLCLVATGSRSADNQEVDKLTTYAALTGRALACGMDMDAPLRKVGAWVDRSFHGQEKALYIKLFSYGMEREFESQKNGTSPDSCDSVRQTINKMIWP